MAAEKEGAVTMAVGSTVAVAKAGVVVAAVPAAAGLAAAVTLAV